MLLHKHQRPVRTCITDHGPGPSCCWPLPRPPHQSRLDSRRLLPLPSGQKQGKPHCSVPWSLAAPEPLCSNCMQLTLAPSCNISECAFKRYNCKGWENREWLETPLLGVVQVLWLGLSEAVCAIARFPPALPVPCFLTAAALAPCSPSSQWREEVTFWTIWWEVGKAQAERVRSVHLTQKDC